MDMSTRETWSILALTVSSTNPRGQNTKRCVSRRSRGGFLSQFIQFE